jgi:hypothetical protein
MKMIEMMVYGFVPVGAARVAQVASMVRMPSLLLDHPARCKIAIDAVTDALQTRFGCVHNVFKNLEAVETVGPKVEIPSLYPCRDIGRRQFQRLALKTTVAQLSSPPSRETTEEEQIYCLEDLLAAYHHVTEECKPCHADMKLEQMSAEQRDKQNTPYILPFEETITL